MTMTDGCFRLDELDSLLDLGPEDPRRQHLAECPLCRARLAAYRTFLAEGPPLSGSRPELARAELERFVTGMVEGGIETEVKGVVEVERETGGGFWTRLCARRIPKRVLVPGLVTAAAAVILIIVLYPFTGGELRRPAPLRGLDSPGTGRGVLPVRPAVIEGGTATFRWTAVPDADSYQLQLFDTSLEEVARFGAGSNTTFQVQAGDIPAVSGPLLWRVVAFRGGDEFARSRLSPLDLGEL
jgi:hypothetical protein